jgi:hypothetical protein
MWPAAIFLYGRRESSARARKAPTESIHLVCYSSGMQPERPREVDPVADACLRALAQHPAGAKISIGGGFGLAHYHEFRPTHDVDAWWEAAASESDKNAVMQIIQRTLEEHGDVFERRHGDVISIELRRQGKTVFAFQIAARSALLQPTAESPWPPVRLDSLPDLIASKMTALIERGAPRDFVDIREVCRMSLATPQDCWTLWDEREKARGVGAPDRTAAAEAVLLHLSRIERTRPLANIKMPADRERAQELRNWFKHEFTRPQLRLD